jgi:hypothetical protein
MADLKEQHICIRFCSKLGNLHPETKPGFTAMTQQHNSNPFSGNACPFPIQRTHSKSGVIIFYCKGIVHQQFVPTGHTMG